jgi:hypothetical protein
MNAGDRDAGCAEAAEAADADGDPDAGAARAAVRRRDLGVPQGAPSAQSPG